MVSVALRGGGCISGLRRVWCSFSFSFSICVISDAVDVGVGVGVGVRSSNCKQHIRLHLPSPRFLHPDPSLHCTLSKRPVHPLITGFQERVFVLRSDE